MTCRFCGSKQAMYDEGDIHECVRCHMLVSAIKEQGEVVVFRMLMDRPLPLEIGDPKGVLLQYYQTTIS